MGYKVKLGASRPTDNKGHPSSYFAGSDYVRLPLSEYNSGFVSLSSPPASAPSPSAPESAAAPPPTHISSSAAAAKRSSRSPSSYPPWSPAAATPAAPPPSAPPPRRGAGSGSAGAGRAGRGLRGRSGPGCGSGLGWSRPGGGLGAPPSRKRLLRLLICPTGSPQPQKQS